MSSSGAPLGDLQRSSSTGRTSGSNSSGRHHQGLAARLTGSLRRSNHHDKASSSSSSATKGTTTTEAKYDVSLDYPDLDLHSAAAAGNVGLVHYALTHGQPINSVLHGVLPLHAACAGGSEPIVRMLIDRGADVNAPRLPRRLSRGGGGDVASTSTSTSATTAAGVSGSTPLHFAAANGHSHIVRILLACGAIYDKRDKQGNTPGSLAVKAGHEDVVHTLETWQDMVEGERERLKAEEEERNRLERETYPDASPSSSATATRKSLDVFHRREGDAGPSAGSAGSSRRPSLPSIFEKATHPGATFKTAFRRPSAAQQQQQPMPAAIDTEPAAATAPRGRLVARGGGGGGGGEDDVVSVASSRQLSRQSLLHLFHRARRDRSPGSESPSPPRTPSVALPPDQLEESIERIRRASIEGSPSKKRSGRRSRSGSQAAYHSAHDEEDEDEERNPPDPASSPTKDRTTASPPSSPLAHSFGADDPPSSSEEEQHLPVSDRTLRPPAADRPAAARSPLRLDMTKIPIETSSSQSLHTSPVHMTTDLAPLPHSEPASPIADPPAGDMRRSPSEGSPVHTHFHRTDSTSSSSNRAASGRIRLGTRSRGASLSSVASSIVALQQIDGRTVAIVDPTTLRDAVVSGKRQWSTSSASSALSGFGFGSVAGTSYTPPSTLSSHEPRAPPPPSAAGGDDPPLPKERLARKLSKRKTQSPAMLYNLPMASSDSVSVSRRVSSRDEARELVKKSEQDLLAALTSGPNASSASLAEQFAAYGDSLALEHQLSVRPSLTKQDSADSNVTVTTESSKPSASRSYVDSSSYTAKGHRATSFTANSSVSANQRHESSTSRRSLNEARPSTIYVAQAPTSIPSINRIYETRAAAYREQGLALRNSAPIYNDTRRHSSNPVHSHWIMTDTKSEGRSRRKVSGESSSRDSPYLPSVVGSPRSQDTVGPLSASVATTSDDRRRRRSREAVRQLSLGPPPAAETKHRTSPSSSRRNSLGRELDRRAATSSSQEPSPEKHSLRVVSDALAAPAASTSSSAPKHSKWTDSIRFKSPFSRHK